MDNRSSDPGLFIEVEEGRYEFAFRSALVVYLIKDAITGLEDLTGCLCKGMTRGK